MSGPGVIDFGLRTVLALRGPDTVRYLNGQVTQDVRRVVDSGTCLPACVTDAKGKIQFRVWLTPGEDGAVLVDAPLGCGDALMARLGRYLIADDVEIEDLSGQSQLWHVIDEAWVEGTPSLRWRSAGRDLWLPKDGKIRGRETLRLLSDDEREALRIARCLPGEGSEPIEGSFPAELGLDGSDVSFHKGCYIGQEVISRIQTVKKVNRRLCQLEVAADVPPGDWVLQTSSGEHAGIVTSISPLADHGKRLFLAMVKRGKIPACIAAGGEMTPVRMVIPVEQSREGS